MNNKNSWQVKPMTEVVKWGSGGTPKATVREYYENGTIPWLVIGDLNDGIVTTSATKITQLGLENSSAKVVPANTLLVAMYGSIGKLGITGMECCTNQAIAFAKELIGVTTKYMYYFMMSSRNELIEKGKGGTQKNISQTVLNSINVPVPPFPEQQRIVAKIEELFAELDNSVAMLKKVKEQLEVYRQAVLKISFDNMSGMKYVKLSSLGLLARGKSKYRPRNADCLFENGKYPFFQTGDVKAAEKYLMNCSKMYGDFGLQQSKLWPIGTLCITIAANIAETCLLGVEGCFPDSVVGFIADEEKVNVNYVRYFIEVSKERLWMYAPATAQKNINLSTLENLQIPYCTLKEQNLIVDYIDKAFEISNRLVVEIDKMMSNVDLLRQSILKKAFEGEL